MKLKLGVVGDKWYNSIGNFDFEAKYANQHKRVKFGDKHKTQ